MVRSGSLVNIVGSATEREPGASAGEFCFDAIASGMSASTPVGALSLSAQLRCVAGVAVASLDRCKFAAALRFPG
jgi:hypothetical protein